MIALRAMRDSEYSAYLDYFIPDYAVEIAANYRLSQEAALAQARREIDVDLPNGVNTAGEVLKCFVDASHGPEQLVGYIWYRPDATLRSVFIADFHILAAHQGQGLGKQAMRLLEGDLKAQGFTQIKLRVAGDNARARHVYEASGFQVTGVNMSKVIGEG